MTDAPLISRGEIIRRLKAAPAQGHPIFAVGCSAVIMCHAPETGSLPLENCIIAMTYLDLASASLSLGTS